MYQRSRVIMHPHMQAQAAELMLYRVIKRIKKETRERRDEARTHGKEDAAS